MGCCQRAAELPDEVFDLTERQIAIGRIKKGRVEEYGEYFEEDGEGEDKEEKKKSGGKRRAKSRK